MDSPEKYSNEIEVIYEPLVREYLGQWAGKKIYVEKETAELVGNNILIETIDQYNERIAEFYRTYTLTKSDCVVTHSMCVAFLTKHYYSGKIELEEAKCCEVDEPYYVTVRFKEDIVEKMSGVQLEEDPEHKTMEFYLGSDKGKHLISRLIYRNDEDHTFETPDFIYANVKDENELINLKYLHRKTKNIIVFKFHTQEEVEQLMEVMTKLYNFFPKNLETKKYMKIDVSEQ